RSDGPSALSSPLLFSLWQTFLLRRRHRFPAELKEKRPKRRLWRGGIDDERGTDFWGFLRHRKRLSDNQRGPVPGPREFFRGAASYHLGLPNASEAFGQRAFDGADARQPTRAPVSRRGPRRVLPED